MRGRVARMRADRHLERGSRFIIFTLRRVQDSEIVVWLGQFGIVLNQAYENGDRVSPFVLFS